MFAKGLPRNLGDPDVSTSVVEGRGLRHRRSSEEEPVTATPRCLATQQSVEPRSEETKRRGMGGRKSEHPESTDEAGEANPARSGGGKRGAGSRNC